jgi:hypothetical protein
MHPLLLLGWVKGSHSLGDPIMLTYGQPVKLIKGHPLLLLGWVQGSHSLGDPVKLTCGHPVKFTESHAPSAPAGLGPRELQPW